MNPFPPYVIFDGTIHSLEMILYAFDIKDFYIDTTKVGTVVIETGNPICSEAKEWLEHNRAIGVEIQYRVRGPQPCICFGPPAKDCPIHGC